MTAPRHYSPYADNRAWNVSLCRCPQCDGLFDADDIDTHLRFLCPVIEAKRNGVQS